MVTCTVIHEGMFIGGSVRTQVTGERFLSCVRANVTLQIPLLCRGVRTQTARERFLSSVGTKVDFEFPGVTEHLITESAGLHYQAGRRVVTGSFSSLYWASHRVLLTDTLLKVTSNIDAYLKLEMRLQNKF